MEDTSQGNLSFLMDKGKRLRWAELSPKGRIPYVKMKQWLDSKEKQINTIEIVKENKGNTDITLSICTVLHVIVLEQLVAQRVKCCSAKLAVWVQVRLEEEFLPTANGFHCTHLVIITIPSSWYDRITIRKDVNLQVSHPSFYTPQMPPSSSRLSRLSRYSCCWRRW